MKNTINQINGGSAILIKTNTEHRIIDEYIADCLEALIERSIWKVSIAATYLPPRLPHIPFPDFHKLIHNNHPTYIIGDFIANHRSLGYTNNNTMGISINTLMSTLSFT